MGSGGAGAHRALPHAYVIRRRRFREVVDRQLDLFEREHAGLIGDVETAEHAYDRVPREQAEERYGDYLDLVETATELLAELRANYATTLDDAAANEYQDAFNRAVLRRFPHFALELEDL